TKVGALFGEAVVFTKHNTPKHFLTLIKQHGALLAKGFVLGAQFDALFTDNLYFKIARNANEAADRIREALRAKGYTLTFEAPTNQIFVTMDQPTIDRLEREVKLGFTEKADDTHTVMRICTSWATTHEEVDQLIELL
ncbi:amino acid lyase, partial [Escherichia coli]|nr:amino acid lyase [Escherichia coli]